MAVIALAVCACRARRSNRLQAKQLSRKIPYMREVESSIASAVDPLHDGEGSVSVAVAVAPEPSSRPGIFFWEDQSMRTPAAQDASNFGAARVQRQSSDGTTVLPTRLRQMPAAVPIVEWAAPKLSPSPVDAAAEAAEAAAAQTLRPSRAQQRRDMLRKALEEQMAEEAAAAALPPAQPPQRLRRRSCRSRASRRPRAMWTRWRRV